VPAGMRDGPYARPQRRQTGPLQAAPPSLRPRELGRAEWRKAVPKKQDPKPHLIIIAPRGVGGWKDPQPWDSDTLALGTGRPWIISTAPCPHPSMDRSLLHRNAVDYTVLSGNPGTIAIRAHHRRLSAC
jgi:hypothetical protein